MAYPPPPPRRPIGVAILAILIILGGVILTLIFGLALLAVLVVAPAPILLAAVGIAFILSLVLLLAGVGLWKLRPWAWWLAVIVVFLELVFQALAVDWRAGITFAQLLPMIIVGILFVYLLAVRSSFRSSAYPR